jgi:Na+/proline symporter/signal transduction histidine kinase
MFAPYNVFFILLSYLLLLFGIAWLAERQEQRGRSLVNNPYVYSLSLAVYCTSWTFYGSVGRAATSGLSFLPVYLGPTLMAALTPLVLARVVRIAKANGITTISDFLGYRYGKSLLLSALVAGVAVVGVIPYIGLQIKAIISTFEIISHEPRAGAAMGLVITLFLGGFAIIFGARRLDASERHGGLVFAVAFESLLKLLAFLLVGAFVTWGIFDGFGDIFARARASSFAGLLELGGGSGTGYAEWFALLVLSGLAVLFLPRQFHMAVVENSDERHLGRAAWLFPLYLFLINIFVVPIALAGLLTSGSTAGADYFVLSLPLAHGMKYLSLLVFLGGFSAATSMVIVESLALSTMAMNSIVMPALIGFHDHPRFPGIILGIKRVIILAVVYLGYLFAVSIGEFYSLVDIGLKSFEAVTLFAPAFLLGIFWRRGSRTGAIAGLLAGFAVWFYTLIVPALYKAGILSGEGGVAQLDGSLFDPAALFGVHSLGKWGNSLFWSLLVNVGLYVGISLAAKPTREDEIQALLFVESDDRARELPLGASFTVAKVEGILSRYIGPEQARAVVGGFLAQRPAPNAPASAQDLRALRAEAERVLSGAIGSSLSAIVFEDKLVLTERERSELSASLQRITANLRLSRQELAQTNLALSFLQEFSANIIESAPVGIATVDPSLRVNYWNRGMETLSRVDREAALDQPIDKLLPWLSPELLAGGAQRDAVLEAPGRQRHRVSVSPFKDPSGGVVIIVEDITEKAKMEEQLLQSSKLASIGRLTAGISHEIGNPLAAISSLVQELTALGGDDGCAEFERESLRAITTHLERISRIVRSLGDFARVSTAEKVASDLREILRRTIELVRYDKRFRKVRLQTEFDAIPALLVNPDQMEQVFLNLLLNALDAMPEGGELRVRTRTEGPEVVVRVEDTGRGIEAEALDRVFDPFFTTKPVGKGTGLGLSICYGTVRDHGGTIAVASTRGSGTTFTIRLPIGKPWPSASSSSKTRPPSASR